MTWKNDAACKGMPTEWWFPDDGQPSPRAMNLCATCPVRIPCLRYAVRHEPFGIWGGVNQTDRHELRRF